MIEDLPTTMCEVLGSVAVTARLFFYYDIFKN